MKPIDSSARTLGLIGFSIFVHGAAFWAFNENISLKQMAQIVQETREQATRSEMWEKLSENSQEVEVDLTSAEEVTEAAPEEFEFKKVESVTPEKKIIKKVKTVKAQKKEIATQLPEKKVIEVAENTPLPKTTVTITDEAKENEISEPENLEPEIKLIPASQWIDGVAAAEADTDSNEVTEASAQIEKTPREIEETNLLAELQESEQVNAEQPSTMETIRSYLGLRQAAGNRPPQYPLEARRQGLQGRVLLKYFVTDKGFIESIEVAKSSGHKILDDEAVRAISSYRFYPGQSGWAEHPVRFSLNKEEIPAELGASN